MPSIRLALAALLALSTALPAAAAEQSARLRGIALSNDVPIQIDSDALEILEKERKAVFTGNVRVAQGQTTLKAGHMVVYYRTDGGSVSSGSADIDRLEVSRTVVLTNGNQKASGDQGVFNMRTEVLVLSGKQVVLSEGKNVFTGCKLTVEMKTGQARLEACGGRVRIQLDPKTRKQGG